MLRPSGGRNLHAKQGKLSVSTVAAGMAASAGAQATYAAPLRLAPVAMVVWLKNEGEEGGDFTCEHLASRIEEGFGMTQQTQRAVNNNGWRVATALAVRIVGETSGGRRLRRGGGRGATKHACACEISTTATKTAARQLALRGDGGAIDV